MEGSDHAGYRFGPRLSVLCPLKKLAAVKYKDVCPKRPPKVLCHRFEELLEVVKKVSFLWQLLKRSTILFLLFSSSIWTTSRQSTGSKQAIKAQLAQFLKQAREIQNGLHYSNFDSLRQKQEWEKRVERYLEENLDGSYAIRFQNPGHPATSFPQGINAKMTEPWAEMGARMAMLNSFLAELRD